MLKKHFRDIYLIAISFIAGVLFIIQCGGQIEGIAEDIASALDISFDNSETNLDSSNLQDAIVELAQTVLFVYDATGEKIGIYVGNVADNIWQVWDMEKKVLYDIEPSTGEWFYQDPTSLYYESSDCTGTAYLVQTSDDATFSGRRSQAAAILNGSFYWYVFGGITKTEQDLHSQISDGGSCEGYSVSALKNLSYDDSTDPVFVEATQVETPDYQGPLFIR